MTYIIAEIGTSHQGSLSKAKEMISTARDAGADCVKFQWVYADEILHPDTGFVNLPTGNIRLYDRFKELEVSSDFFAQAAVFSHECGVDFACSPFGLKSLSQLLAIKPDAIKIASPELNHYPMLKSLYESFSDNNSFVPVILSSGVSTLYDIQKAITVLSGLPHALSNDFQFSKSDLQQQLPNTVFSTTTTGRLLPNLSLLHCITCYPAPETEYNLNVLKTLAKCCLPNVGVSDHSLDPILVPSLSVLCGGTIIEKHITLSRETSGLDDPVALTPEMFTKMVKAVRETETFMKKHQTSIGVLTNQISEFPSFLLNSFEIEKIKAVLGDGEKRLAPSEKVNYTRTNRSLHYMRSMSTGETIKLQDIAVLRTEKVLSPGISPEYYYDIPGHVLTCDVTSGEGVQFEHFNKL